MAAWGHECFDFVQSAIGFGCQYAVAAAGGGVDTRAGDTWASGVTLRHILGWLQEGTSMQAETNVLRSENRKLEV